MQRFEEFELSGEVVAKSLKNLANSFNLFVGSLDPDEENQFDADAYYTIKTIDGRQLTMHAYHGLYNLLATYARIKIGQHVTAKAYTPAQHAGCSQDNVHALRIRRK